MDVGIYAALTLFIILLLGVIYLKHNKKRNSSIDKKIVDSRLQVNAKYASVPKYILFDNSLKFLPVNKQVFYIENTYNTAVNQFINCHYEEISSLFRKRGYKFTYIPFLNKKKMITEIIRYNYPNLKEDEIDSCDETTVKVSYDDLLSYTDEKNNLTTGFLRFKRKEDNGYKFSYFGLTEFSEQALWQQIVTYLANVGDSQALYRLAKPETDDDIADFYFSDNSMHLVDEIKERIEQLREIGINEVMLKSLLFVKPEKSRMQITKDYRIILTDYNNIEISMAPLPKAIFFLFLKHPEGILFKRLSEYRDELKQIYLKLSTRSELKDIDTSINNVVDSTKNTINENCSRIRESFIREFDESLAKYYYVTGNRAETKKIIIDRSLVTIECNI